MCILEKLRGYIQSTHLENGEWLKGAKGDRIFSNSYQETKNLVYLKNKVVNQKRVTTEAIKGGGNFFQGRIAKGKFLH